MTLRPTILRSSVANSIYDSPPSSGRIPQSTSFLLQISRAERLFNRMSETKNDGWGRVERGRNLPVAGQCA